MTSKISFYILNNDSSPKGRILYTCRIIEKAYSNNHKIYVYTSGPEETKNIDTQLWTFNDISFVPHEIYSQEVNLDIPILIGHDNPSEKLSDILINLTTEIAPFYQQFNHTIEVIPNDDSLKSLAREHFRVYKKNGHSVDAFNV